MRIAFVSLMGGASWAASEALWAATAERALQEGHAVFASVYAWDDIPQALARLRASGAAVELRPRARWLRRSRIASRLTGAFRQLERFAPDVVCVNQGGTYDVARGGATSILRDCLQRMGVPYVLLCHCEQPPPSRRHADVARPVFERAAFVGLLGERLKRDLETQLQTQLPNARVFHNPVNLERIEYSSWPETSAGLRFAFVGRLDPVKNLAALIDALSAPGWQSRDWVLDVFGMGSQRAELEALVAQRSLQRRIRFAGHVSDIGQVWRAHHVLLLPSRFEGLPLAVIEAMLCGRPVLAVNTGGISEWINDGETGFLADNPDALDIGRALERLWDSRSDLERMGRLAHERTLARRDPDPVGTLLATLEDAASRGTRSS